MCGFSANAVAMLESLGAPYVTFDVLADEAIRGALKEAKAEMAEYEDSA